IVLPQSLRAEVKHKIDKWSIPLVPGWRFRYRPNAIPISTSQRDFTILGSFGRRSTSHSEDGAHGCDTDWGTTLIVEGPYGAIEGGATKLE
ncbi:MAG TPA: hypothetical protein VK606_09395, partial [Verrucomicrobiae bacterium]|nr:hypothetical protein [Verrucomicrobiae bacterium]